MPRKDAAGIYIFDHSNHGDSGDEALVKEVVFLRALVEDQKREIEELKTQLERKQK